MTVMAATKRPGALGILAIEEAEAWAAYLEDTRGQPESRYEELEPWAWGRLGQRLRVIEAKRRLIEDEDGA